MVMFEKEFSHSFRLVAQLLTNSNKMKHNSICSIRRRVTIGGRGEVSSALLQKLEKSDLICGKKCPDGGHLWVKFSFKMQFLRVSRRKNRRFFPYGAFLSCVVGECLSKCPNSKKSPLT